jgi:hypothetical protein
MFGRFMGRGLLGECELVGGEAVLGTVSFFVPVRWAGRKYIVKVANKN